MDTGKGAPGEMTLVDTERNHWNFGQETVVWMGAKFQLHKLRGLSRGVLEILNKNMSLAHLICISLNSKH